MSTDGPEIELRLWMDPGSPYKAGFLSEPVRGFQIGRYAVVACDRTVTTQGRGGDVYHGGHLIVHWESGACIARSSDFVDGCWLADYFSAFGPDIAGTDALAVHRAVMDGAPPDLIEYLTRWGEDGDVNAAKPSFLVWRAARAARNLGLTGRGQKR
jgi:hypothetical protein